MPPRGMPRAPPGGAIPAPPPKPTEFLAVREPGGAPPPGAQIGRHSNRGSRLGRGPSALALEPPPIQVPEPTPKRYREASAFETAWEWVKANYPRERTPLVVALLLLMGLPGVVLLVTGTWRSTACNTDATYCREECRVSWDIRKGELIGEAKYVVRNELEKTQECYDECEAVRGRCGTEVMMLFIGVGCFAGAAVCGMTIGVLIGMKKHDQVEELEAPRVRTPKRKSAFDKRPKPGDLDRASSRGSLASTSSDSISPMSPGPPPNMEAEEEEEMTEEERMYERERKKALKNTSRVFCPDCENEFRTRLPFGNQRKMGVSPVVCPLCGYVLAGIL